MKRDHGTLKGSPSESFEERRMKDPVSPVGGMCSWIMPGLLWEPNLAFSGSHPYFNTHDRRQ
jgi:hypothetical protein